MFRTAVKAATRQAITRATALSTTTTTTARHMAQKSHPTPHRAQKWSKKGLKYTPAPVAIAAWTFANSPTFEATLTPTTNNKPTTAPVPLQPTIFSGSEGLTSESFGSWIRALLARVGHYDLEKAQADIEAFGAQHDDIEDEIDRAHLEPETFVWCKDHLDEIFRFANYEGMNESFEILSPVAEKLENWPTYESNTELFNELIKFKTFIEKERYKYFRRYEEITEHTAEMGDSLDRMNVMLAQANPYNEKMERYVSHALGPIYNSVHESLLSIVDVSSIIDKPLLHAQLHDEQIQKLFDEKLEATAAQLFPVDRSTWSEKNKEDYKKLEYAVFSRALYMLRTQALTLNQANTVAESLNQLYHELSWDFKTYYDENTVNKIMTYAQNEHQLSGEEREDFFEKATKLPIPPLFNLKAVGLLNLYVQKVNLQDMVKQLEEDRDENDDSPFDPTRLHVVSAPVNLLMRLVNADKQVLIPSIHHRSQVYHELHDVIERLKQRPYIIYGLQKRMKDIIAHPREQDIHNIMESYSHSAKQQRKKKHSKATRHAAKKRKQHAKAMVNSNHFGSGPNGFENLTSHQFHPDHDDFHVLQHNDKESLKHIVEEINHGALVNINKHA